MSRKEDPVSRDRIMTQSKAAYNQWCIQWRENAKIHSKFKMKPLTDFANSGLGRAVLCAANGYSLEENIESIKKYQHNIDILACDKSLGNLIDNGINPKFVMVCDANVSYEKYMEKWKDKLQDTILFISACANPKWTQNGNWKDVYFFINKDILNSEKEFSEISGCTSFIPAGTNVSNAMVVFLTQSDERGRNNFFGYDKIVLIGYDYSWRPDGKYYAFDQSGGGKANYMRHVFCVNLNGNFSFSSGNLCFSAQWLEKYIKTFKLNVVQGSGETILNIKHVATDLVPHLNYLYKPENARMVMESKLKLDKLAREYKILENMVNVIGKDHMYNFLRTA